MQKVLATLTLLTSIFYAPEVVLSVHRYVMHSAYYRKLWPVLTQWCTSGLLVHFLQFDEQSVQDGATSLVRRPLQFLVAELGVDFVRCSDSFLAHFVAVWSDQNLKCHLAVVSVARFLVFVPVIIITIYLQPQECELKCATYGNPLQKIVFKYH